MNSPAAVNFPAPRPKLKLPRSTGAYSEEKWTATLAEERRRLLEDQEALRLRESNLRDYEARLRALQADIDAGRQPVTAIAPARAALPGYPRATTRAPFEHDEAGLRASWEKLHRSRELFEAEQMHLRNERIAMQDQENDLRRRVEAVTIRENRVTEREKMLAAAVMPATPPPAAQPVAAEHTMSAVTRLTCAPFDMARSIFGGKKSEKGEKGEKSEKGEK